MSEQRAWSYRSRRPSSLREKHSLRTMLTRRAQPAGQPVSIALADLVAETDLSPYEAILSLQSLAEKGLLSIFPPPRLTHIGKTITYAVVWLGPVPTQD